MSKVKKALCVALALMMLIVPMSIGVNAAPATGKEVALKLTADSTTVAPGDTVTLKLTWDVDDWSRLWGLPCYILMYDGTVFGPNSNFKTDKTTLRKPMGDFGQYVVAANGVQNTLTSSIYGAIAAKMTDAEKKLYTTGVQMTFSVNNDEGYTTAGGIQYTDADTVQCEFYLQVAADAAPGTYNIAMPAAAYTAAKAYINCCDTGKAVRLAADKIDVSQAVVEITVATPAAGPTVAKSKGQIKMTKTGADTVADDFSFRVISKITDADWDAYFSGTLDSDTELGATNAIQKVGFVVAESGNFAMDAAKAAAKKYAESANPDAEDLGVYKAATTNFIQKTDDASDALFACRIDTSVSTKSDRKYIAFVQYKDGDGNIQYAFYDEVQEILLDSKYGDYKAAWLSQNQG